MSALAVLWFFLIFVLIAGYFVLDGFDLGVGVLYRALAKTDAERALVRMIFRDEGLVCTDEVQHLRE